MDRSFVPSCTSWTSPDVGAAHQVASHGKNTLLGRASIFLGEPEEYDEVATTQVDLLAVPKSLISSTSNTSFHTTMQKEARDAHEFYLKEIKKKMLILNILGRGKVKIMTNNKSTKMLARLLGTEGDDKSIGSFVDALKQKVVVDNAVDAESAPGSPLVLLGFQHPCAARAPAAFLHVCGAASLCHPSSRFAIYSEDDCPLRVWCPLGFSFHRRSGGSRPRAAMERGAHAEEQPEEASQQLCQQCSAE